MALETQTLRNKSNCMSIRVNVVVCANDNSKREIILENQTIWEPEGHIAENTDETKRETFENQTNWERVGDIMDRGTNKPKGTKFENNNWEPVGDIMEQAIAEAKIETFENQRNWNPASNVLEHANEEKRQFEDLRNWEPVNELESANQARMTKFENDSNWEPENNALHRANHEAEGTNFEKKPKWESVEDEIEHTNQESRERKFQDNQNWKAIDEGIKSADDKENGESIFENERNWQVEDIEHDNNGAKRETLFQVVAKQCTKENPNWAHKSIGDIYLNQIKGDFVLSPELLQSPNLYFTLQGQTPQSTLNEYQTEIGERRFIEINKGTPGKVVQIPLSLLQDPGFNAQMPFEIPVPPLIPITNKRKSSITNKQIQSKPNEQIATELSEGQMGNVTVGKRPESILPDFNSDNSIELPPLVPIRKKYKVDTEKVQTCPDKCCDKIHTETSVFKKPVLPKDGDSSELLAQKKHKNHFKKFLCSKCDFVADYSYQLKIHISLTHDANNHFKCNYCDYKSKYKKALYQHQKTHTELRCNLCDYTCRQKSNLKTHQRTHKVAREVAAAPRTLVHGAFSFCSGNSTTVRSQSHTSVGPGTTHTYTDKQ